MGCSNADVTEKELTLKISKQLAVLLTSHGYTVSLIRDDDRYLALDERTAITNACAPDLFVSIHVNASKKSSVSGIETFCLSSELFTHKKGFEGEPHLKKIREVLYRKSQQAADTIHKAMLASVRVVQPAIKDRKVHKRVSQVLFGINSPGVLLEVGYISHNQESLLLQDSVYQNFLVQGIARGIDAFCAGSKQQM